MVLVEVSCIEFGPVPLTLTAATKDSCRYNNRGRTISILNDSYCEGD